MKKRAYSVPEFLFALVGLFILVAALFPMFYTQEAVVSTPVNCQSNLKRLGVGVMQYVQDYDEKYPLINSGKDGWATIVKPYVGENYYYQCPQDRSGSVDKTTDYFYNAYLSGQNYYYMPLKGNIVMLGDGDSNSPANFSITRLPKAWTRNSQSPSLRHLNTNSNAYSVDAKHKNGANYAYADGHVKWLRPEQVTNKSATTGVTTFELP